MINTMKNTIKIVQFYIHIIIILLYINIILIQKQDKYNST